MDCQGPVLVRARGPSTNGGARPLRSRQPPRGCAGQARRDAPTRNECRAPGTSETSAPLTIRDSVCSCCLAEVGRSEKKADAGRSLRRGAAGPRWLVVGGSALRRWPALRSPAPCRPAVPQRSGGLCRSPPAARGRKIARSAVLGNTHDACKRTRSYTGC